MFINLSNHPSKTWTEEQVQAASVWGEILDIEFPDIDPTADEDEIMVLAESYFNRILQINSQVGEILVVHLMGELTFCFALLSKLQQKGIKCVASTSRRETQDNLDGSKTIRFRFVRFREFLNSSKN